MIWWGSSWDWNMIWHYHDLPMLLLNMFKNYPHLFPAHDLIRSSYALMRSSYNQLIIIMLYGHCHTIWPSSQDGNKRVNWCNAGVAWSNKALYCIQQFSDLRQNKVWIYKRHPIAFLWGWGMGCILTPHTSHSWTSWGCLFFRIGENSPCCKWRLDGHCILNKTVLFTRNTLY